MMMKSCLAEEMIDFESVEVVNISNLSTEEIMSLASELENHDDKKLFLFLPYEVEVKFINTDNEKILNFQTNFDTNDDMEYFLQNIININEKYPDLTLEVNNYKKLNNLNIPKEVIAII